MPWLLALLLGTTRLAADDSRPFYLQLTEVGEGSFDVYARAPIGVDARLLPRVRLPKDCAYVDEAPAATTARFRCAEPLGGRQLELEYPRGSPAIVSIVRLRALDGAEQTRIVHPREPRFDVPRRETRHGVARDYTVLGIEHIWLGIDHLLFVACLLWIAGSWRRVLVTITGFTLAHSITLGLAALGVLRVAVPPVEAAIALSVLFLAREIACNDRSTVTWRYPIAIAASFGLLHGFGFAAALAEVGLPERHLLTGLLFFNVGVEIGQVIFAGAMLALFAAAKRLRFSPRGTGDVNSGGHALDALRRPASYLVGSIAAFWFLERVQGLLG
ncbi:MAG: HupE/UreJ family protein [Gammaproteobacteria bacterium]|nr:HupE/UreJ family protein [Gammaproteobacteria bacterium]